MILYDRNDYYWKHSVRINEMIIRLIHWLILTACQLVRFYVYKTGNCVHWKFLFTFAVYVLKRICTQKYDKKNSYRIICVEKLITTIQVEGMIY